MRTGKNKAYIYVMAVMAFAGAALFFDYAGWIKEFKDMSYEGRADAIVVLTGGVGRAEEGLNLLRSGRGAVLILSGVHEDADIDSIFFANKVNKSEKLRIILEKQSQSTYDNAFEVKRLMKEKGLTSMVLITSAYHMKRADFIFRRVMDPDVRIYNLMAATPNFDTDQWWAGRGTALLAMEFLKYYWYSAGFSLGAYKP